MKQNFRKSLNTKINNKTMSSPLKATALKPENFSVVLYKPKTKRSRLHLMIHGLRNRVKSVFTFVYSTIILGLFVKTKSAISIVLTSLMVIFLTTSRSKTSNVIISETININDEQSPVDNNVSHINENIELSNTYSTNVSDLILFFETLHEKTKTVTQHTHPPLIDERLFNFDVCKERFIN